MFEAIGRALERHLDPAVAKRRADFWAQQAEARKLASTLFEVLHTYPYNCFNAVVSGTIPGDPATYRILLCTDWRPDFAADPPQTSLERADIRVYDITDNPMEPIETEHGLDHPKPFMELELRRGWEGWGLEEKDYRFKGWPYRQSKRIERNPEYVRRWVECAKDWRR